jgi:hypothetical protein
MENENEIALEQEEEVTNQTLGYIDPLAKVKNQDALNMYEMLVQSGKSHIAALSLIETKYDLEEETISPKYDKLKSKLKEYCTENGLDYTGYEHRLIGFMSTYGDSPKEAENRLDKLYTNGQAKMPQVEDSNRETLNIVKHLQEMQPDAGWTVAKYNKLMGDK